jgi:hypothetical protein
LVNLVSLNALVYRSRGSLNIDVEALGAVRDDRTGEYYFPTPEHNGELPRDAFIAFEFWIGNVMGVAELRAELAPIIKREDSLLLQKCLYSGSHSGDVIECALLPTLEHEVRELLDSHGSKLSECLISVLHGILALIESARKENNPIVFV